MRKAVGGYNYSVGTQKNTNAEIGLLEGLN
jgi:hypothetical protein